MLFYYYLFFFLQQEAGRNSSDLEDTQVPIFELIIEDESVHPELDWLYSTGSERKKKRISMQILFSSFSFHMLYIALFMIFVFFFTAVPQAGLANRTLITPRAKVYIYIPVYVFVFFLCFHFFLF